MRNFHKLDMASTDWLTTHFLAKSADRIQSLASLPISTGSKVLDLCCGPGLFIPYLLNLVGPTGYVTGLDFDPISLDAAHQRLTAQPHKNWSLQHARLEEPGIELNTYDVVLLFNSIGYFSNPADVVRTIAASLRSGSLIIVKDFDLESFFFHPRDTSMWAGLIQAAKSNNDRNNPVNFDNFMGRKVHTLHRSFDFSEHTNRVWTQLMAFPFNNFELEYIWRNIECLLNQAEEGCPIEVRDYFTRRFFPPEHSFFSSTDALFVEVEYLALLRV